MRAQAILSVLLIAGLAGCGDGGGGGSEHDAATADARPEVPDAAPDGAPRDAVPAGDALPADAAPPVENGGGAGEACLAGDRCRAGNRCQDAVCVPCRAGSQSCACKPDGTCNAGLACDADQLCVAGLSVAPDGLDACHTPCTRGLDQPDGSYLDCPDDHLLDGCFGGTVCTDGQCLVAGDAPVTCTTDADCPDFQACLPAVGGGNRCASDCATDDQCAAGSVCYRRVCRLACDLDQPDNCPPETFCDTVDGQNGRCMPLSQRAEPSAPPQAEYTVDTQALDLSADGRGRFVVTNTGHARAHLVILKVQSKLGDADAVNLVDDATDPLDAPDCGDACPLPWLEIGDGQTFGAGYRYEIDVDAGASATVEVRVAAGMDATRWTGALEVHGAHADTTRVALAYAASPAGRWLGSIYYFGDFKDDGVDAWVADRSATQGIRNALVRYFAQYRAGTVQYDELAGALVAARDETWRAAAVQAACGNGHVCFPYDNRQGFLVFSNDPEIEVPSGAVELPFAMSLRGDDADADRLVGRIESGVALQYPGEPGVQLDFESNPAACDGGGDCVVHLAGLSAQAVVGGRYFPDAGCDAGFQTAAVPWLVPGFTGRSRLDAASGNRVIDECRDTRTPLDDATADANLARANPIPDGRERRRVLELIDGFVRNRTQMVILFRERTGAVDVDGDELVAYGYMSLSRQVADADPATTTGNDAAAVAGDGRLHEAACSADLLATLGTSRGALDAAASGGDAGTLDAVAAKIVGLPADGGGALPEIAFPDAVHAYCEDTGFFDGGPADDGSPGALPVECPAGSRVTYFVLRAEQATPEAHQAWIAGRACQQAGDDGRGTCGATLDEWVRTDRYGVRLDPAWRCADGGHPSTCDGDRHDLRAGKTFFADVDLPLPPFRSAVADAFRYRTRFATRDGDTVGFAPSVCQGRGDGVSYCYEPDAIEAQARRADCAVDLYTRYGRAMSQTARDALATYLEEHFGYATVTNALNETVTVRGFEPLYAELLIMLGDEDYTHALTSRFDLAGAQLDSFAGDLFEAGGIRLSGIPGAEMVNLHAAVQHYQIALDRFYTLLPAIRGDIARAAQPNARRSFITTRSLTTYVDKLIRASTQKAKAQSQIATRYQGFNRPELARKVIERAYTAAYLESSLLTHLMNTLIDVSDRADRDQIRALVRTAQTTYRGALHQMREVYETLDSQQTYFGYAPDYVPFPSIELGRDNPFEVALFRAQQRMSIASQAENLAIESDRSFNTDQASFENELTRIRNTYESQLLEVCGGMEINGVVYPAIAQYADLDRRTLLVGDPCGLVGSGAINDANLEVAQAAAHLQETRANIDSMRREARLEEQRIDQTCHTIHSFANYEYTVQGQINTVEDSLTGLEQYEGELQRRFQVSLQQAGHTACEGFNCLSGAGAVAEEQGISELEEYEIGKVDDQIRDQRDEVAELQRNLQLRQTNMQCDLARIDGQANVERILLQSESLKLEALQAAYAYDQAASRLQQLRLQAKRLQQELDETLQQAVNVEAARNDPNVRIYRSDAVINADYTFQSAVKAAYVATRVLEYYTSQSYAGLDDLFLVRMVDRGDHTLQQYLIDLEDAFRDFEDHYGLPSNRVLRVSLKDDIFGIPLVDADGRALGTDERNALFVRKLTDSRLLDEHGYVVVPFDTRASMLSPLTRNHQINYVSAQLVGSNLGDIFSRVYLRMTGTGTIAPLGADDTPTHYLFPPRTAVIEAFQSERRSSLLDNDEVYRSRTLASRPVINTEWDLVLNMVDEPSNTDFRLEDLTDVRLYFYYTDFVDF